MKNTLHELLDEFRTIVLGRNNLVDAILPPLLFALINTRFGFTPAMASALALALVFLIVRLLRRQTAWSALAGIGGVALALALVFLLDREEGFFLPGIVSSGGTALVAVLSNLVGFPMVAWTSALARRWPRAWYQHPRVRPAYADITWLWALYFGFKLLLQFSLFQNADPDRLAWLNLVLGWPGTVALLIVTYVYGTWRLRNLGGPSVEEFKQGAPPPWTGQQRGF